MKKKTLALLVILLLLALALPAPPARALEQTPDSPYRLLGDPADPGAPIAPEALAEESEAWASGPARDEAESGAPVFDDPVPGLYANQTLYPVSIAMNYTTFFAAADWSYYAYPPNVVSFFDCRGLYNVVYFSDMDERLHVQRYDGDMNLDSSFTLAPRYPMWGNAVCDDEGNYYVIWAQNDTNSQNTVVTSAAKYDYNGNFLGECTITGFASMPFDSAYEEGSYWGTKLPFDAGNCSVALKDGVLACNYAREMYSGHQSNFVFYVDCRTMKRIPGSSDFYSVPYCSHSFDQRIIITSDGGYLTANHGDASHRSFYLSKMAVDRNIEGNIDTFHFREGANRSYGYNETYAQLGGIAETESAYVLLGASERTLSLANAPTNQNYCGHSEARDLFIQYVKKDFYNYSDGPGKYAVSGETRRATGVRPETSYTNLYLTGSEVDYGVIWLTAYDKDHYANNPQLVATDDGRLVVLWEKLDYETYAGTAYYAILSPDGRVLQQPLPLKDSYLNANIDPVYHEGKIYWTTKDSYGSYIHCLELAPPVPVSSLYLEQREYELYTGDTLQLDVRIEPADASNKQLLYTVSDPAVVKADAAGRLTALRGGSVEVAIRPETGTGEARCHILVRWRVRDLFNDMFEKDWWYDAVQYAYDNGVMNGKGAYFDPKGNLTREQFAQVLYNHSGAPAIGEAVNPFSDVKQSGWYYQAVIWANQNGVAAGRGATFGVNDNITRQELARMLYNYAKLKGYDLEMSEGVIESYVDYDQVAVWGREGFDWAVSQGIITGKGTPGDVANYRLDPGGLATRAECAMMMMRLLQKNGK